MRVALLSIALAARTTAFSPQILRPSRFLQTSSLLMSRKPGVSDPSTLSSFVSQWGPSNIIVVDARNTDFTLEPGDAKTNSYAPIAGTQSGVRPNALNLPYDRVNKSMDLTDLPEDKSTPIISHCGGGGRGQKAKDYLIANGYENVLNGGGPEDKECWEVFGEL